jgi:hypothetical protein
MMVATKPSAPTARTNLYYSLHLCGFPATPARLLYNGACCIIPQIPGSLVIARNTAFTYKGKAVDAKQVARELGVRYVLEGSVRRMGDQVQANVQLIDGETGTHVWADRFETDRRNLAKPKVRSPDASRKRCMSNS